MLPTNEKAALQLCKYTKKLVNTSHNVFGLDTESQNLYILSNEEIMVGDWYYTSLEHDNPFIRQCKVIDKSKEYWLDNNLKYQGELKSNYGSYKIIATTNPSVGIFDENNHQLYYYPSPSKSFIQKYVDEYNKVNIITEVLVEYNTSDENMDGYVSMFGGKEIGDTLKINSKENTITIKRIKVSYSREEVIELCRKAFNAEINGLPHSTIIFNNWVKENL
jgi:hypothetical protein